MLDGVNHTGDDLHAWLAPFRRGRNHYVGLKFPTPTTVSMIRIWNYNKSRIHSYRGARYVEMALDHAPIFKGEIRRASGAGATCDIEDCSECVLFTTNDVTLKLIERYDRALAENDRQRRRTPSSPSDLPNSDYRPGAAAARENFRKLEASGAPPRTAVDPWMAADDEVERPRTSCGDRGTLKTKKPRAAAASSRARAPVSSEPRAEYLRPSLDVSGRAKPLQRRDGPAPPPVKMRPRPSTAPPRRSRDALPRGRRLELVVLSNWGDPAAAGARGGNRTTSRSFFAQGVPVSKVNFASRPRRSGWRASR